MFWSKLIKEFTRVQKIWFLSSSGLCVLAIWALWSMHQQPYSQSKTKLGALLVLGGLWQLIGFSLFRKGGKNKTSPFPIIALGIGFVLGGIAQFLTGRPQEIFLILSGIFSLSSVLGSLSRIFSSKWRKNVKRLFNEEEFKER